MNGLYTFSKYNLQLETQVKHLKDSCGCASKIFPWLKSD